MFAINQVRKEGSYLGLDALEALHPVAELINERLLLLSMLINYGA